MPQPLRRCKRRFGLPRICGGETGIMVTFIGTGLLIMGIAYFLCGLIPAFFIKDRLFDPQKAD